MAQKLDFPSIVAQKDDIRVVLDYIGEGRSGDYDDEDPEDIPLMRVYIEREEEGDWTEIQHDASACLMLPATTPKDKLQQIAADFLQQVLNNLDACFEEMVGDWTWLDFRE
jgi:hypothetical protein